VVGGGAGWKEQQQHACVAPANRLVHSVRRRPQQCPGLNVHANVRAAFGRRQVRGVALTGPGMKPAVVGDGQSSTGRRFAARLKAVGL